MTYLATRSSYIATFFHGTISISIICTCDILSLLILLELLLTQPPLSLDYFPVFFQACQGASPIRSSTKFFAFTFVCPALAIVTGAVVQATRRYRPANFVGWAFIIVGMGLFTLFRADASPAQWIGFMVIEAIGIGIIVRPSSRFAVSPAQSLISFPLVGCNHFPYSRSHTRHPHGTSCSFLVVLAHVRPGMRLHHPVTPSPRL